MSNGTRAPIFVSDLDQVHTFHGNVGMKGNAEPRRVFYCPPKMPVNDRDVIPVQGEVFVPLHAKDR
jgi:hypothetical protein